MTRIENGSDPNASVARWPIVFVKLTCNNLPRFLSVEYQTNETFSLNICVVRAFESKCIV